MESDQPSLYERVGGEIAIMAAVRGLYERLLADATTRPFFESLDLDTQVRKQIAFMTWVLGGPVEYRGRDLRTAHASLVARGLGDAHFDALSSHLEATLRAMGIDEVVVHEAVRALSGARADVLGR